jgi:hypothetical protein
MIFQGLELVFQGIGICIGEVERPNLKKSNEKSFKKSLSLLIGYFTDPYRDYKAVKL